MVNTDLLVKQTFRHHGYKLLDAIDHIIMIMVTRTTTTNSNDSILNEHFHRIGATHCEYKIKQDHIDVRKNPLIIIIYKKRLFFYFVFR
jgi:hypothetical protein